MPSVHNSVRVGAPRYYFHLPGILPITMSLLSILGAPMLYREFNTFVVYKDSDDGVDYVLAHHDPLKRHPSGLADLNAAGWIGYNRQKAYPKVELLSFKPHFLQRWIILCGETHALRLPNWAVCRGPIQQPRGQNHRDRSLHRTN